MLDLTIPLGTEACWHDDLKGAALATWRNLGRPARFLGRKAGFRGAFLLFLALLDFVYAFGLGAQSERSSTNPTTLFLASIMPLWAWALLWLVVGLACLVSAFLQRDQVGFAAASLLKAGWALMFLLGWLFADVERGYLSTAIWGAFGLVTLLIGRWLEPGPLVELIKTLQARVIELEATARSREGR